MKLLFRSIACAFLAAVPLVSGAQQVYRIVGPDGRVTFSDRPPPDARAAAAPIVRMGAAPAAAPAGASSLPFELRNAVSRFPVTLFSGANCAPCGAARNFLNSRGIPFAEKTVSSNEDIEALQRLSGATTLPFLTIGGQQFKGYSEAEWAQFLDAAGYPRTSQLPSSWRNPEPAPLVVVQQQRLQPTRPQAPSQPAPGPSAVTQPVQPAGDNPAGIRF